MESLRRVFNGRRSIKISNNYAFVIHVITGAVCVKSVNHVQKISLAIYYSFLTKTNHEH